MVFNGVHEDKEEEYKKWRIMNSWGHSGELEDHPDFGYIRCTDEYMNKYVYEAVIDVKYFEEEVMQKILENEKAGNFFTYKATDAFGTVARLSCKCCSHNVTKRK